MARTYKERTIKYKVPIETCENGYPFIPVKGKCGMCEQDRVIRLHAK